MEKYTTLSKTVIVVGFTKSNTIECRQKRSGSKYQKRLESSSQSLPNEPLKKDWDLGNFLLAFTILQHEETRQQTERDLQNSCLLPQSTFGVT